MVEEQEVMSYEKLRILDLSTLEKKRPQGLFFLVALYNFLRRRYGVNLFYLATNDRTNGNDIKLHQWRLGLDIRKKFFTVR